MLATNGVQNLGTNASIFLQIIRLFRGFHICQVLHKTELEIQHAALWKSITQHVNIEHTYTAHASFHTALDIYVMAVGHNNTTVGNIQYAAHSTISTRQLKSTTRTLNITTRT